MTVSRPYLSPGLTRCLTIRTVIIKTGIPWEPRRSGGFGTPDNIRGEMEHYRALGRSHAAAGPGRRQVSQVSKLPAATARGPWRAPFRPLRAYHLRRR